MIGVNKTSPTSTYRTASRAPQAMHYREKRYGDFGF
jgi:hypothetical protein